MPEPKIEEGYLNRNGVMKRYSIGPTTLLRLRNHKDPNKRLPEPDMFIGDTPVWSLDDLRAFEARQRELSKGRKARRPMIVDSATETSRRSRARQQGREQTEN